MWRIAENTFKKRIRKSNFQTFGFDESFVGTYWVTPEEKYWKQKNSVFAPRVILLSKQYRETTVAYYFTGKSCSEISADFGISTEMVKYYLLKQEKY